MPSYLKLMTLVKRHIDHKIRPRNFEAKTLAGDFEDSKSTLGKFSVSSGVRTFVPKSSMCKKQTSVSHSCTETEVISSDAWFAQWMVFRLSGIWLLKFKNSSLNQSSIQGNLCDDEQSRKRSEVSKSHTEFCKEVFQPGILPIVHKELILQNCMVELPRNHFSEIHFDKFLDPSTFQCWKTSSVFLINHLHQVNRQRLVLEMCMQEVFDLHVANCLSPKPRKVCCKHDGIGKTY